MNHVIQQNETKFWEALAKQELALLRQLSDLETDQERRLLIESVIELSKKAIEERVYETESGRKRLARIFLKVLIWSEHAHFLSVILKYML